LDIPLFLPFGKMSSGDLAGSFKTGAGFFGMDLAAVGSESVWVVDVFGGTALLRRV
jgi:hypothetical protein